MTKTVLGVQGRAEGMIKDELQALVDEQAEDEGLWFRAEAVPEAYLQQELRKLHALIEARRPCACEGRKLLYRGKARIFDVRGETAYLDAPLEVGSLRIRDVALEESELLEVLVFLSCEEEPHGD